MLATCANYLSEYYVYLPLAFFALVGVVIGVFIWMQPQNKKIITFQVFISSFFKIRVFELNILIIRVFMYFIKIHQTLL